MLFFILIFLFIVLIFLSYIIRKKRCYNFEKYDSSHFPLLPALNYYSFDEPDYFYYDPIVYGDDESSISKNRFKGIFGPDNYFRYYS